MVSLDDSACVALVLQNMVLYYQHVDGDVYGNGQNYFFLTVYFYKVQKYWLSTLDLLL